MEPRSRASSPDGDGVSPGRTFPKRCANFGNKTKLPDDQLLALAGSQSRVLFTHDTRFKALAESWQRAGRPFGGLLYGHAEGAAIGQYVRDLELIAKATAPAEMASAVIHLPLR